jgi:hypothetical protein
MKPAQFIFALTLVAFGLGISACNRAPKPVTLDCPPGTKLVGQGPPDGGELFCARGEGADRIKEGPIVVYRDDGKPMMQGHYHDGKQDGEWTLWYDNGQKKSIDHYAAGILDGGHVGWYDNGKISAVGDYKNGKREGTWKRWDPNGFRNWEEIYKDDIKVS